MLNSKKRYEVNKGIKNFKFSAINPTEFKDALFAVQVAAFSVYPIAYRPKITSECFSESMESWNDKKVYAVFYKENNLLCGYAIIEEHGKCLKFSVQKTMPEYEKYGVNAALVAGICNTYEQQLQEGFYIVDGERNIKHETHFQDYLEKYFGFRKAYCKLNIIYKWYMKAAVICLYPFRKLLRKLNSHSFINQINAVLKMENYYRAQKKRKNHA